MGRAFSRVPLARGPRTGERHPSHLPGSIYLCGPIHLRGFIDLRRPITLCRPINLRRITIDWVMNIDGLTKIDWVS